MKSSPRINYFWRALSLLTAAFFVIAPSRAQPPALVLLIQPMQGEDIPRRMYRPLADYLEKTTGSRITIVTTPNFIAHWGTVRRNRGFDLVLDDAHFTDYRVRKFGFHVLVKFPGTVSYSLAVPRAARQRDLLDLAGKKVASFGPPSLGATRLYAMFPNPARRPAIVEVASAAEGLTLLTTGRVAATMLPTSALSDQSTRGQIRIVATAEPTPNMALSASPTVDARMRKKIRDALLQLGVVNGHRAILEGTGIDRFEAATPEQYAGQSRILREYWGY